MKFLHRSGSTLLPPFQGASCSLLILFLFTPNLQAIHDTNQNGASDLWEKKFNHGALYPTFNPTADPDGDGWTNAQEATAGSDPGSGSGLTGLVRPEITHTPAVYLSPATPGGPPQLLTPEVITVTWHTVAGKKYNLLFSTDLAAGSWTAIGSPRIGEGTEIGTSIPLTQPDGTTPERLFWRVTITDVDTDNDTLTDAEEAQFGSDPHQPDTDGDKLTDSEEYLNNTDPNQIDTDQDGLPDEWEVTNNLDPNDDGGLDIDNGPNGDPDGDGIKNLVDSTPHQADELVAVMEKNFLDFFKDHGVVFRYTKSHTTKLSLDRLFVTYPQPLNIIEAMAFVSFDGDDDVGELTTTNVWIEAKRTTDYDRNIKLFHLLDTNYPSLLNPDLPVEVRKPLDFNIHAHSSQSDSFNIYPGVTDLTESTPNLDQAAYIGLINVEWRANEAWGNVDDHIDPWTKKANGKRIFPDFKDPDATELRHKLEVIVKTSPALFGRKVYVKSFDVDDSTSEDFDLDENGTTPVIDTNGKVGDDNLTDYLNTPKNGQFWTGSTWGGQTAQGTVDANGETKFIFRVGMQPGSNYRVVASLIDETMYADVQTSNPLAAKYLGPEASQDGGTAASPLLTVWRRLWIENDSMGEIGAYSGGNDKKNDLTSDMGSPTIQQVFASNDLTTFYIPSISDGTSFTTLQNGTLKFPGIGDPSTPSNTIQNMSSGVDAIQVAGNKGHIQVGSIFRLYDDDGFGLNSSPLPRNDLVDDRIKGVYRPAFIEVMDANPWNDHKTVDFYRSHPPVLGPLLIGGLLGSHSYGVLDDALDAKLEGNKNLWCASVIVAYQPGGEDSDPNDEESGVITGVTIGDSPQIAGVTIGFLGKARVSIVYSEVVRDQIDDLLRNGAATVQEYEQRLRLTAAHEVGHQPLYGIGEAAQHEENGLMADGGHNGLGAADTPFSAKSIKRFRIVNQWRQKAQ